MGTQAATQEPIFLPADRDRHHLRDLDTSLAKGSRSTLIYSRLRYCSVRLHVLYCHRTSCQKYNPMTIVFATERSAPLSNNINFNKNLLKSEDHRSDMRTVTVY